MNVHVLTSVLGVSDGGSKNLPINHTEAWAAVAANRQLRERRRAAERDFNDTGCGLDWDAVVFVLLSLLLSSRLLPSALRLPRSFLP